MKFKTLAAIDIGSNAVRFIIKNIENENENVVFKKVAYLRVPIRLGEDTFTKGYIGESKLARLNEAMIGFSHIMRAYKVSEYKAFATSAMREASNGAEVVESVLQNCGIDIKIITGKEEAQIIFKAGGLNPFMNDSLNYLYVDVGGGSTEVIVYSKDKKIDSQSFQIGTVRMLTNSVQNSEITAFENWLEQVYNQYDNLTVIASGGNINKILKILDKKSLKPISYKELLELYDQLKFMSYEERMQEFGLNAYRADVIIPALKIFLTIGRICDIKNFYVPKVGLVDGIIHDMYSNHVEKYR